MYRGSTAEFQIGVGGFDGNQNLNRIPYTNLILANNIRFDGDTYTKAPGLLALDTDPIPDEPSALAGFDWHPVTTLQHQITAWDNGTVYKEQAGNASAFLLADDLNFTQPVTLVSGDQFIGKQKKLYLYSQGVNPQILNSTSNVMVPMTTGSLDWLFHSFLQVQEILYTAVQSGTGGDAITIEYVDPGANNQPLTISVVGNDISISLATGAMGAITTNAYDIMNLVTNDEDASALVFVQLVGSGTAFQEAFVQTNLDHDGTEETNYPSSALMHDYRMAAYGCPKTPHAIYFSNLDDHSDFSTDNPPVLEVKPGFSERVACCFSFLPQQLFVFKFPYGVYRIDTTDIATEFTVPPIITVREDIGMAGEHAIARVGNDVWFVGADAHLYSLTSVQNSEDLASSDITSLLHLKDWLKQNVNMSRLRFARIHYDTERQEAWIMYPRKGHQFNSIGLVIDVTNPANFRIAVETRGSYFQAMWASQEQDSNMAVRCAGDDGIIYKANQATRSIGMTIPYEGSFEFPQTNLDWITPDLGHREKRFDWLEIWVQPTGDYTLIVDITIDGIVAKTIPISVSSANTVPLDLFVLDQDALGGISLERRKIKINGIGNKIGIRVRNSGLGQNFIFNSLFLYYKPLGIKGLV